MALDGTRLHFDEAHHRPHAARLDLQVISIGNGPRGEEIIYISKSKDGRRLFG
jgi:hypothetical protein